MGRSLWEATAELPSFPPLEQDEQADVLIIGGGMAGILCAHFLQQAGVRCLLCEANTIGSGTSGKTTAVVTAQHDTLISDLAERFGRAAAKQYLDDNLAAVSEYRRLCRNIDCDFEEKPSYLYSRAGTSRLKAEVGQLRSFGFAAELVSELPIPVSVAAAVKYPAQAQFHPLKFIAGLARGLEIREHTQIKRIRGLTAYTQSHKITAGKIIVASHFPIMNTHGLYFAKLYQKRSYVVALEHAGEYDGTFADNGEDGFYFRNYRDLLLVGGGDHRTGKPGGGFDAVRRFVRDRYPHAKERYAWSAQDCMSLDGVPYIGRYGRSRPEVLVASGFNEWGMTSSMTAARLLTDMAAGGRERESGVFTPSRSMLCGQLWRNLGTTLLDFVTPSARRCPHLGCVLKWNAAEHSWDCPCHGSRFAADGRLIDNPATGDCHVRQV